MQTTVCCRDRQGHVVTNYHVVRDASDLQVTLQGGKECHAKVVGFDADKDIAVLQIDSDLEVRPMHIIPAYSGANCTCTG